MFVIGRGEADFGRFESIVLSGSVLHQLLLPRSNVSYS